MKDYNLFIYYILYMYGGNINGIDFKLYWLEHLYLSLHLIICYCLFIYLLSTYLLIVYYLLLFLYLLTPCYD